MKSKFSLVLFLVLLVLGMAGRARADSQPLALAIGYEQALNLGDINAMSALFADDAVYVNTIGGDPIVGRDTIRQLLDAQSDPDRAFEITDGELRVSDPRRGQAGAALRVCEIGVEILRAGVGCERRARH